MAYSKKDKEKYKVANARKTNSKRFPNGYLYILSIPEHHLYKVGVSQKPRRRIRDIKGALPFESEVIFLRYYKDVYSLEEIVHKELEGNLHRKEWFHLFEDDVKKLKALLEKLFLAENN